MRQIKLKRVALVVVTALATILSLHVLLAVRLARSEDEAGQEPPSLQVTANALPQLTHQPSSGAHTKPIIHAVKTGPLRTLVEKCAPSNVSSDLYESYFMNRRLCKEPLLEDLENITRPTPSAQAILFTLRTTAGYHRKRLPVLFDTWLSDIVSASNCCHVAIITDARDEMVERAAYGLGKLIFSVDSVGVYSGATRASYRDRLCRHALFHGSQSVGIHDSI